MRTYEGDVNSASGENLKEPSSSTILPKASFNGHSIEETLNVKFTQCKTSHTLKIYVFKLPDNENIGKVFSKYFFFLFIITYTSANYTKIKKEKIYIYIYIIYIYVHI